MDTSHLCLDWRDGSLSYAVSSDPHVRSSVPSLQSARTFVRFCAFSIQLSTSTSTQALHRSFSCLLRLLNVGQKKLPPRPFLAQFRLSIGGTASLGTLHLWRFCTQQNDCQPSWPGNFYSFFPLCLSGWGILRATLAFRWHCSVNLSPFH